MKKCTICGEVKPHTDFHKQASRPDGRCSWCKPCKAEKKRDEYLRNKDKYLARTAEYRIANPEKVSEGKKAARLKKLDQYSERSKMRYEANKDVILAQMAEYRAQNKDKIRKRNADYNDRNRESKCAKQREYQAKNRAARQAYRNEWKKRRKASDPLFWLIEAARSRISCAFRNQGYKKTSKAQAMLGCEFDVLHAHIESGFKDGMGWHNRGEWEIDHIIPLASAKDEAELMKLCHYKNLQPLWKEENRRKGAKIAA